MVRLLQSGLIRPEDLLRKYTEELHAGEIVLLAYYIAAVNIEAAFHQEYGRVGSPQPGRREYVPFEGIVLTDTFQLPEDRDSIPGTMLGDNSDRVRKQQDRDIRVIIGNPPYSSGQTSQNDNNQNQKYGVLDSRIADTYAAKSTAQNKNSLYDSYIRAIRWASDRVDNEGVVCFVSNGGYIDGNTADGLRRSLVTSSARSTASTCGGMLGQRESSALRNQATSLTRAAGAPSRFCYWSRIPGPSGRAACSTRTSATTCPRSRS